MGEFPAGEFPGPTGGAGGEESTAGAGGEPGFEDSPGASGTEGTAGEGLPDLRDTPSLEDSMGALEAAMGEASGGSQGNAAGSESGSGSKSGSGVYGIPGSPGGGQEGQQPYGNGTLTPAEQVAILDAQLERGTGEFDAMILEEQAAQRRAAREQAARQPTSIGGDEPSGEPGGSMADGGGYSMGGGMPNGSVAGPGGSAEMPQNTAKYPPPTDIPPGSDDDVVARQLREAAMREPDPAVREKLWDEYRKYKGISN